MLMLTETPWRRSWNGCRASVPGERCCLPPSYVPAAVLFVPGSLLTLGAGFVFGLAKGTVIVSLGSTAGAAAAFIVARSLARDWVVAAHRGPAEPGGDRTRRRDRRLQDRSAHAPVAGAAVQPAELRIRPDGRALPDIRARVVDRHAARERIMYVYLGSAAKSVAALLSGETPRSAGQQVLFVLGLAATVAADRRRHATRHGARLTEIGRQPVRAGRRGRRRGASAQGVGTTLSCPRARSSRRARPQLYL